ncbi:ANTAR domain-containing response regulator [Shewanella kaireitica]|uniref:ANTAR domain-containing response regulator n=1 Tax=Shewanella kaireitica TaxID=212021 RepID=UPI00200D0D29|nr:ANTAR domain-containing protein [Shewanella kaireitica]MCL1094357.1 ANTAR domain-containing protein [Shewanella kaireitica]
MRLVSLVEELESHGLIEAGKTHDFDLVSLKSISEFERFELKTSRDVVLLVVETMTALHLQFIERLMTFAPVPLIITARNAEEPLLSTLLQCGRITFVPQHLDFSRLMKIVELAQVRFETVNRLHQKVAELEHHLEGIKRIQLAKHDLQQSGLSEQEAHRVVQKVAMDRRISLPDSAAKFCKNQLR